MKSLRIALTGVALLIATAHLAVAQDEDASPAPDLNLRATDPMGRSEPSVVVPSESARGGRYPKPGTPLTTPTPAAASASPSPTRTRNTAAAASPTPAKAAPSPTPAKAAPSPAGGAAATAAAAGGKTNIAATIRDLESRWAAAIQAHDTTVPQQLVAADYVGVNSAGRVVNKAALLAEMKRDKNNYTSATNSGVTVRAHGNMAVAVGTTRQAGTTPDGKSFNYTYRWTDTWLERNGQWQCVASQSFLVTR
jgi:ketosteroid isomerase-like protein